MELEMLKLSMANKYMVGALVATAAILSLAGPANALTFDQNVTPDVIFGSGNPNGFFTVDEDDGVELGLRAKIPFVGTINSNGDGTYSYTLAETDEEPAGAMLKPRRWNFDWTVNTDTGDSSGRC